MKGPVLATFGDCRGRARVESPGEAPFDPLAQCGDGGGGKGPGGGHFQRVGIPDRLKQPTSRRLAGNHNGTIVAPFQHGGPTVEAKATLLFFRPMAGVAVFGQQRSHALFEEPTIGLGGGRGGGRRFFRMGWPQSGAQHEQAARHQPQPRSTLTTKPGGCRERHGRTLGSEWGGHGINCPGRLSTTAGRPVRA